MWNATKIASLKNESFLTDTVRLSLPDGDALKSETFSTYNTHSNSIKTNLWVSLKIIVKLCFPINLKTGPTPSAFLEKKRIPINVV